MDTATAPSERPPLDALEIARIAFRHWYILAAGIVVTGLAAVFLAQTVQPTYESTGSFLLASPDFRGPSSGGEQAEAVVDGAAVVGSIVADAARGTLVSAQPGATYTVEPSTDGSILLVSATAEDATVASATLEEVVEEIESQLVSRQEAAGIPIAQRRAAKVLSGSGDEGSDVLGEVVADPASVAVGVDRFIASASILIVSPLDGSSNPYSSSSLTLRVLEEVMRSPDTRAAVLGPRATDYVISQRSRDTAPILYITATGATPQDVDATYAAVVERVRGELARRQSEASVPEPMWVTVEPLAVSPGAWLASRNLMRPLAAIVGLGGVAALSLTVLAERLARTRGSSRGVPFSRTRIRRTASP